MKRNPVPQRVSEKGSNVVIPNEVRNLSGFECKIRRGIPRHAACLGMTRLSICTNRETGRTVFGNVTSKLKVENSWRLKSKWKQLIHSNSASVSSKPEAKPLTMSQSV